MLGLLVITYLLLCAADAWDPRAAEERAYQRTAGDPAFGRRCSCG